ncbi:porin [Pseudomonas canadensis]|uniref:Porin n=1 Tax=Pseudomonas canadensis TaxID=915099 RepID=A0ABZ0ZZJ5_9PSED|nr:porin [Pseudomonas canadensis]WRI21843.1 porin [Pseudomonas canadensis]
MYRTIKSKALCFASVVVAGQASAQSGAQIYGLTDLSLYSQQLSEQSPVNSVANGNVSSSYIGFRGSEDLGDGVKASFQLESFFRADTGEIGRDGNTDSLFHRQAWVRLSSTKLGTLRLGRTVSPGWQTIIKYGPFGGPANNSPIVMQTYQPSPIHPMMTSRGASDGQRANSISYSSTVVSGFSVLSVYAPGEGGPNGRREGAMLNYEQGPLGVAIAAEKLSGMSLQAGALAPALVTQARPGYVVTDDSTVNAALSYDLKSVKLFGQLARTKPTNTTSSETNFTTSQLGASIPLEVAQFTLAWGRTEKQQTATSDLTRDTISAAYTHFLSKRTDL